MCDLLCIMANEVEGKKQFGALQIPSLPMRDKIVTTI